MSSVSYEDSQTVWEEKMAEKVLRLTRDELTVELPFLSNAFSSLLYKNAPNNNGSGLSTSATDGEYLYYRAEQQLRLFEDNPKYLTRLYLHSIFHLLFSHLWLRGDRDPFRWGVACDIAVEHTIDRMGAKRTGEDPVYEQTGGGPFFRPLSLIRQSLYREFETQDRPMAAAVIYRYLDTLSPEMIQTLSREFFADDHFFWPQEKKLNEQQVLLQKKWQQLGKQAERRKKQQGDDPDEGAQAMSVQLQATRSERSYRQFLHDFMVMREELRVDPDEFDLGYYMYGLSLYKNMPLIEPLETREEKRIQDFVVVVDTSYSTSGEPVKRFLRETFRLLTEQDSFFRSARVHVIQADEEVQSDTVLSGEKDIEELFSDFTLKGGGNTDFRPAFRYVNQQLEEGVYEQLCGLLYFTDGRGIYPKKQPPYKTAFLYIEPYEKEDIPPWAIHFLLD
ncbi:MAG: metallopeptidase [Eubacterium sp.]|nr:metallopeptidase [Eubacterium sp.]